MVESKTCATKYKILPIVGWYIVIKINIFVIAKEFFVRISFTIVFQQCQFILPFSIIRSAKYRQGAGHFFPACKSVVVHHHFTFLARFSSHYDYTIGATRSVNGGRRCILEHIHTFNVAGCNVADRFNGKPIHYEQWFIVACNRSTSTHTDFHFGVGRTFGSSYLHTGKLTRNGFDGRSNRNSCKRIGFYRSYRACNVLTPCSTITNGHYFIQHAGIVG